MLNPDALTHSLVDLMAHPGPAPEMARAWSRAYANYAASAQTILGGQVLSLEPGREVLEGVLTGVFANPYQLAPQTAASMSAAFTAFWIAPPVVTTDAPPGAVTAVVGTALLQTALISTWLSNFASRASNEQAAQGVTAALHAFTISVLVTIPIVPTPVISPLL